MRNSIDMAETVARETGINAAEMNASFPLQPIMELTMTNEDQGDLLHQIRESLERIYAEESPEKKRIRQMNREQVDIAGSGEWDDPYGRPAPRKKQ